MIIDKKSHFRLKNESWASIPQSRCPPEKKAKLYRYRLKSPFFIVNLASYMLIPKELQL